MTKKHLLSKSTFLRGLQCHKSLYLNRYRRDLRDEISSETQAVFATGREVGELAIGLVPFGAEIIRSKMLSIGNALPMVTGLTLPMPHPLWTDSGFILVTESNTAP